MIAIFLCFFEKMKKLFLFFRFAFIVGTIINKNKNGFNYCNENYDARC